MFADVEDMMHGEPCKRVFIMCVVCAKLYKKEQSLLAAKFLHA